jgi:hypothetical protein
MGCSAYLVSSCGVSMLHNKPPSLPFTTTPLFIWCWGEWLDRTCRTPGVGPGTQNSGHISFGFTQRSGSPWRFQAAPSPLGNLSSAYKAYTALSPKVPTARV